jgi:hypothetical protein
MTAPKEQGGGDVHAGHRRSASVAAVLVPARTGRRERPILPGRGFDSE